MPRALTSISGIGPAAAETLKQHGFKSAEAIAQATAEELSVVPGFGTIRSENTIKAAIELVNPESQSEAAPEPAEEPVKQKTAKKDKKKSSKKKKSKAKKSKGKKDKDKKKPKNKDKKKKDKKKKKKK